MIKAKALLSNMRHFLTECASLHWLWNFIRFFLPIDTELRQRFAKQKVILMKAWPGSLKKCHLAPCATLDRSCRVWCPPFVDCLPLSPPVDKDSFQASTQPFDPGRNPLSALDYPSHTITLNTCQDVEVGFCGCDKLLGAAWPNMDEGWG